MNFCVTIVVSFVISVVIAVAVAIAVVLALVALSCVRLTSLPHIILGTNGTTTLCLNFLGLSPNPQRW